MFTAAPRELLLLLVFITNSIGVQQSWSTDCAGCIDLEFHPAKVHTVSADGTIKFQTVSSLPVTSAAQSLRARPLTIRRPVSPGEFQRARWKSFREGVSMDLLWEDVEVLGPDTTDLQTLAQLARMTANAYALPGTGNWWDLEDRWNNSSPIGWEPDEDGFRGHIFTSADNSTVILSIKGTNPLGPTSKKDRLNDNLLFSCCCSRVDPTWAFSTVCGCYSGKSRCDQRCVEEALMEDSLFYSVGVNLYNNLTLMYPNANIWLTGHSLGGGIASLLSATFGAPTVAFESPGERLAAERLHLLSLIFDSHPVTHVYHNADPVPQGACNGPFSFCSKAGFALETRCHLGKSIVFDTIGKLKWRVELRRHLIKTVIENVLDQDWEVPTAVPEKDCIDCYKWEFGDYKNRKCSSDCSETLGLNLYN